MVFEKERILEELGERGKTAISKLNKLLKIPYYKLKFSHIPDLEKEGLIKVTKEDKYVYVELSERGMKK